jgi:hypothetical protein
MIIGTSTNTGQIINWVASATLDFEIKYDFITNEK